VSPDGSLSEIVLFEVTSKPVATRLFAYLVSKRLAWLQPASPASVVGVLLGPDQMDLAVLLRDVHGWIRRTGLAALRFEVDGRTYILEVQQPALALARSEAAHGDERPARDRR
jgi:hypothetical protein